MLTVARFEGPAGEGDEFVRSQPHWSLPSLWKELYAKMGSQIRRQRKEGVTVQFGPNEFEPFLSVFARHMRDLETPTQPLHRRGVRRGGVVRLRVSQRHADRGGYGSR